MCAPSLPHGPHGIKWTRRQKRPHPGGHCEAFSRRAGEGRARGETCPRSGDSPRIDAESHCVCLQVTHGKEDLEGMIDVAAEAIIEVRRAARTPPACASVVGARRAKDWPVSQQSSDRGVIITPKFDIGSSGGGGGLRPHSTSISVRPRARDTRSPAVRPGARVVSTRPPVPVPAGEVRLVQRPAGMAGRQGHVRGRGGVLRCVAGATSAVCVCVSGACPPSSCPIAVSAP